MRLSDAEYKMLLERMASKTVVPKEPARAKYGNKKVTVDGHTFDSKKEAGRYLELRLLEKSGLISDLKCQEEYRIDINGVHVCSYFADFTYIDKERQEKVVEDAKGVRTPSYRLKAKLMRAVHGVRIRET